MPFRFIILFIISILSFNTLKAQTLSKFEERKKTIISFLIAKQELTSTSDWTTDNYTFERKIFSEKVGQNVYQIIIFGANSSHAKRYICLVSQNLNLILQTQSLDTDIKGILDFIKKSRTKLTTKKIITLFDEISECYSNNKKSFIDKIDKD